MASSPKNEVLLLRRRSAQPINHPGVSTDRGPDLRPCRRRWSIRKRQSSVYTQPLRTIVTASSRNHRSGLSSWRTISDAAAIIGINQGTVKTRMYCARRQLAACRGLISKAIRHQVAANKTNSEGTSMKRRLPRDHACVVCCGESRCLHGRKGQPAPKYSANVPPSITTPDTVQTRIGTLKFFDGLPDAGTVQRVYDNLDFSRGVEAFLSGIPAASLYACLLRRPSQAGRQA